MGMRNRGEEKVEEFVRFVTERFGKGCGDTVRLIIEHYQIFTEKRSDEKEEVFRELEKKIKDAHEALFKGTKEREVLSEDDYRLFTKLPKFELDELRIGRHKIDSSRLDKEDATKLLYYFGILSREDGKITIGLPFSGKGLKFLEVLEEAILNFAPLFVSPKHRALFLKRVTSARGERDVSDEIEREFDLSLEQTNDKLTFIYEVSIVLGELFDDRFQHIGHPEDFYKNLQIFYAPSSKKVHVYSTTSGLVVWEEYEGRDYPEPRKNRYRRTYFDFLRVSDVEIFYQLDPFTTAKALFNSRKSLEESAEHFSKFLQRPNMEISIADFSKAEWKKFYTLVSPRCGIAFSTREPELKRISKGVIASSLGVNMYPIIEEYYEREDKDVIKPLGKELSGKEAEELAMEVIDRWLSELRKRSRSQ